MSWHVIPTFRYFGCALLCFSALSHAGEGARGTILCEVFKNIGGGDVASLLDHPSYPDKPAQSLHLQTFELPPNPGENSGAVVRGFIHPPASGNYVFWVAADDAAMLFLSSEESPASRVLIAEAPNATQPRAWTNFKEQQSKPVALQAGKKYYIEALYKQGGGAGHLAVGWQLPDGKQERPIPGERLSPASGPGQRLRTTVTLDPKTPLATKPGHNKFPLDAEVRGPGYHFKMSYLLYLPNDYDKSKDLKSMMVFLCGNTHQGTDLEGILNEGPANFMERYPALRDDVPMICLYPQPLPGQRFDTRGMAAAVVGLIDEISKKYRVDKDRVYLTGLSMGGKGTWLVALAGADRFAAIVPISSVDVRPEEAAQKFKNFKTWIVCGSNDGGFTEGSKKMFAALSQAGCPVSLTAWPGEGHGVWGQYYSKPKFYEWLAKNRRGAPNEAGPPPSPEEMLKRPPPQTPVKPVALNPDGSGGIQCEYWRGVPGAAVAELSSHPNFPDKPTESIVIANFEIPSDQDEGFGTAVRGFVHAPQTGEYTFWIASDDGSELWLSTSDDPAEKFKIASVANWTPPRGWEATPEQKSKPVRLEKGRKYYIEALHKEGNGGDNLAVGWKLPDGKEERPIPGSRLSPATGPAKALPTTVALDSSTPLPRTPGHHKLKARAKGQGFEFDLPYLLYLPKDYDTAQDTRPLLLFLHGAGECGTDLEGLFVHGPDPELRNNAAFRDFYPFIGLSPQCIPGRRWDSKGGMAATITLLDEICKQYRVDKDRVYATGLSMGGKAVWQAVYDAPDRFAAVAPISSVEFQPEWIAHRCRWNNVAAWIICGGNDGEFTDGSRNMKKALDLAEAKAELTIVPNEGHLVWTRYYPKREFYEWLLRHDRKQPAPAVAAQAGVLPGGNVRAAPARAGSAKVARPAAARRVPAGGGLPPAGAASIHARIFIGAGALLLVVALLLFAAPQARSRKPARTD